MSDTTEFATLGQLQSHEASSDQRFGDLDKDVALANQRIDRLEQLVATGGGDHVHVAPGHGSESSEIVTGAVKPSAPAPAPAAASPAAATPEDDEPW